MVMGSVVVGDQGALVLGAELPVAPYDRGQGQQPLVPFKATYVFNGPRADVAFLIA
jgi:hypothetical protein